MNFQSEILSSKMDESSDYWIWPCVSKHQNSDVTDVMQTQQPRLTQTKLSDRA